MEGKGKERKGKAGMERMGTERSGTARQEWKAGRDAVRARETQTERKDHDRDT